MVSTPRYAFRTSCSGEVPVMAGSRDERAAGTGDHGHLRASHADREQVIGTLKAAFVQGMLAKDELDDRTGQAFAARTHGELAALTSDIPAGIVAARPLRTPARVPGKAAKGAICVSLALALFTVASAMGPGDLAERLIVVAVFFLPVCGVFTGGLLLFHSWLEKRSRGQLPQAPAPGAGGQASRRPRSAAPGGQLPPAHPGHRHTAETTRGRRPRRRRGYAEAALRAS
jgi:hypothetical protein